MRSGGLGFGYDLGDHPKLESPDKAHTLFLRLMVRKSLIMDEIERGQVDTTATQLLFEIYKEVGLFDGRLPSSVDDIVKYCESVNDQHSHLKFHGSEISSRIKHSEKAYRQKSNSFRQTKALMASISEISIPTGLTNR